MHREDLEPRSMERLMLCNWKAYIEQLFAVVQGILRGLVEANLSSLGGIGSWLWTTLSAGLRYGDFSPVALGEC